MLRAQFDLAVVELSAVEQDPRLFTQALPTHRGVFCCRADHPLLKQKALTLEQVFEYPFASPKLPLRVGGCFTDWPRHGAIDA